MINPNYWFYKKYPGNREIEFRKQRKLRNINLEVHEKFNKMYKKRQDFRKPYIQGSTFERVQKKFQARRRTQQSERMNIRIGGINRSSEHKYTDVTINLAADTTGALELLNPIGIGTGQSQRIGRKIQLKTLELHLQNKATPTTGTNQAHRIIIVYDSQPNGVALTLAELLDNTNTTGFKNKEYSERFKIIFDKSMIITPDTGSYTIRGTKRYTRINLPTTFLDDNNTIADISTGSLFIASIGSNVAGVTAGTLTGYTRLTYSDI